MAKPRNFRTAASFAQHWQGGCTVEEMLSGETTHGVFPSALRRQDKLVGHAIDAALVTTVHSMLLWGHSASRLPDYFFNFSRAGSEVTKERFARDIAAIRDTHGHDKTLLDKALFDYLAPLARRDGKGPLANHRDLVSDAHWEDFRHNRLHLREAWKAFQEEVDAAHVEGRFDRLPAPPPTIPHDPRLVACNDIAAQWLEVCDPHIKTRQSIASKLARRTSESRRADPSLDVRDINRIMIQPDSPQTAERFLGYLAHLVEHRRARPESVPRSFVEPWKVKHSGQFDRMAYLAMTKEANGRNPVNAERGMVAEVKIVAREMAKADKLSAPVYSVVRELDHIERFLPDSGNLESRRHCGEEQKRFAALHLRFKEKFEQRCSELRVDPKRYRFPDILPERKRTSRSAYMQLREELNALNQAVHCDFLGNERGADAWARCFIDVADRQNSAIEAARSLATKRQAVEGNATNERIPEPMLRRVASNLAATADRSSADWQTRVRPKADPTRGR